MSIVKNTKKYLELQVINIQKIQKNTMKYKFERYFTDINY